MKATIMAMVGSVLGLVLAIALGVVTFGIGMAQESVYTIPFLWRAGIEEFDGGFDFIIQPHFLGILGLVVLGGLAGGLSGSMGRKRERERT